MTTQQKIDCRAVYLQLKARALRPGESLRIVYLEYDGDKRRLEARTTRMQKWIA